MYSITWVEGGIRRNLIGQWDDVQWLINDFEERGYYFWVCYTKDGVQLRRIRESYKYWLNPGESYTDKIGA